MPPCPPKKGSKNGVVNKQIIKNLIKKKMENLRNNGNEQTQ